jgi:hypothetical protein
MVVVVVLLMVPVLLVLLVLLVLPVLLQVPLRLLLVVVDLQDFDDILHLSVDTNAIHRAAFDLSWASSCWARCL